MVLQPLFLEEIDDDGVGWITLTRPEVHNAFNDILIAELTTVLAGFGPTSESAPWCSGPRAEASPPAPISTGCSA